jgi:hypothetical protein
MLDDDIPYSESEAEIGPSLEEGEIQDCGGMSFVCSNGKFNAKVPAISSHAYENIGYFFFEQKGRPVWVKYHGKWGVISPSGDQLIPFLYEDVEPFEEDHPEYTWVSLNGQWGLIDYGNVQYWDD